MNKAQCGILGLVVAGWLFAGCAAEQRAGTEAPSTEKTQAPENRPDDGLDGLCPAHHPGPDEESPDAPEVSPETGEVRRDGVGAGEWPEPLLPSMGGDGFPQPLTEAMPLEVPTPLSAGELEPYPVPLRSFNPVRDIESPIAVPLQPNTMNLEPAPETRLPQTALSPTLPLTVAPETIRDMQPSPDSPSVPELEPGLPGSGNDAIGTEPAPEAPYSVVRVFYGTDRNAIAIPLAAGPRLSGWLFLTACAATMAVLLGAATLRFHGNRALRWYAVGALACTVLLGGMSLFVGWHGQLLAAGAPDGAPVASKVAYGNQRGELEYGTCEVSIPRGHQVGQLEAPSIFRLDFHETPERHVVLMGIEPLESDPFFEALTDCVEASESRSALVFVHGFNVTFEDAARRTAQIAYDLQFDGAPIFFSWPSQGGLFKYTIDETNVMWTVPHMRQFLTEVAQRTGARRIHLVAHSMGNRALTSALRDLSFLPEDKRPRFNEVVLTAPDIDAEVFKKDIAPYIVQTADRVTLYASSNDTALAYSKTVHGYPRAGDSGQELLVLPDMETVDVSEVDTSLLGHNYYGSNETVLADLIEVLHKSMPPQQRRWLRSAQVGSLEYWVFQR